MKKWIVISLVGILVLGAVAVGLTTTVFAQDTQPPDDEYPEVGKMPRRGMSGVRFGQSGFEAAADLLGLTTDELTEQLAAGATIADIADKAGLDLQTLRDAVENARMEDVKAQIVESVDNGNMTQEEADWLLRGIENGYQAGLGRDGFAMKGDGSELQAAADALEINVQDLSNQLWAGRTLADIADNSGVDLQTVLDAMQNSRIKAERTRIEEALANGDITQEQADWMIEGLENGYGRRKFPGTFGHGRSDMHRGGFERQMPGGMWEYPRSQPSESSDGL